MEVVLNKSLINIMKLKKCPKCSTYTLKEICKKCKTPTTNPHYKFIKIKDAPKSNAKFVRKNQKFIN